MDAESTQTRLNGQTGVAGGAAVGGWPAATPYPLRRSGTNLGRVAALLCYGFVLAMSVAFILVGAGEFGYAADLRLRITGYIGVFLVLTLAPVAMGVLSSSRRQVEARLAVKLDRLAEEMRALMEHSSLSDDARRVINRRAERDLLCGAIEEDIAAEDWDAALVLVSELADRFGYRAEAEEFRSRIESARAEILDRKVTEAIARLDGLIVQRRWDVAQREAARIMRLYPDSHRVESLRNRVEQARVVYKADLERRFLEAATQDHTEEAMGLLKELDAYLTPDEGARYLEVARGVIGKARENLGVQFKVAVRDKQWSTAAAVGRRIINEFPNTRMANEVRGMLDGILSRANATSSVG